MMNNKIDFVIPWVDSKDEDWQRERLKYAPEDMSDDRNIRYRDFENLQYWFRGVEKFAPWVNKIHFITWGHLPSWLNVHHPKLNIVKHEDYIPNEYLPTFSSHVIEINIHRIKDLAEQFVYFNDDIFITRPVKERDFFIDGYPRDIAALDIAIKKDDIHGSAVSNGIYIINKYFNKSKSIKNSFFKWINPINGKYLIKTLLLTPWNYFTGFQTTHLANAYLKTTFEEVWDREEEKLLFTCNNKFRDKRDLMQYLFKYWQLASGNFKPIGKIGEYFNLGEKPDQAVQAIKSQKYKLICINDSEVIDDFEGLKKSIIDSFNNIFPDKSSFEL